jgi:hypothetical protein
VWLFLTWYYEDWWDVAVAVVVIIFVVVTVIRFVFVVFGVDRDSGLSATGLNRGGRGGNGCAEYGKQNDGCRQDSFLIRHAHTSKRLDSNVLYSTNLEWLLGIKQANQSVHSKDTAKGMP